MFKIFARNIDCGYTLEPHRPGHTIYQKYKNLIYPYRPHFHLIKSCTVVFIAQICYPDE